MTITKKKLLSSSRKTLVIFRRLLPILVAVLMIASLVVELIPKLISMGVLGHGVLLDMLAADTVGSVAAAQPVVSYILAGELQKAGIGLYAVTTFVVSWVTVGIIPLPAEAAMLGWRFAIWRNVVSFFMALVVSWVTVASLHV